MNDKELHKKFVFLGTQRNKITHELLALLPEIQKKGVYKMYGCGNIYEYAARFGGGLSPKVVDKVIKVEEQLIAQGCENLFEKVKEQGIHKIAIVATMATRENEEELIRVVENLPKEAVQQYSKEKRCTNIKIEMVEAHQPMKIELDDQMQYQLEKLKYRMKVNSNKEILKRLIQAQFEAIFLEENFADTTMEACGVEEKQKESGEKIVVTKGRESEDKIIEEILNTKQQNSKITKKSEPRYIRKQKQRQTLAKTNGRCNHPGCNRPATNLHHPDGYAKTKSHENIVPLCEIHHKMEHAGVYGELTQTDILYLEHRRLALKG